MPRIQKGETLDVDGTLDLKGATIDANDGQLSRSWLQLQDAQAFPITLTELRVQDDLASLLPGTAAAGDLAIIEGTFGADSPVIQTSDAKATTVTQQARFRRELPPEYEDGDDVVLRLRGAMNTTVSDGTATVDVECYKDDEDGGVGSDLCQTAAITINSLTHANKDFTINKTGLAAGDVLDFRITIAITDTATATAVIGELTRIALLLDIRG